MGQMAADVVARRGLVVGTVLAFAVLVPSVVGAPASGGARIAAQAAPTSTVEDSSAKSPRAPSPGPSLSTILPRFSVSTLSHATALANDLVGAWSFDEGSGSSVGDASGQGNVGSVSGATWTTSGKFGGALVFNGSSARVNVPNSASLQLVSGMTLEAWVYPASVSSGWRDVVYKGDDNYYLEGTSLTGGRPAGGGTFGGSNANAYGSGALPGDTWSHLALTYDGATLRLYVNGAQVGSQASTGAIATSTNQLQIGGDSIWGQYFSGRIDEVRVYNTALSAAAIQTDMNTPIGGGGSSDTQAPTAPASLAATAAGSAQIDLSWTASTDNVGVTGYRVERCQGAGCSNFAQIASPAGGEFLRLGAGGGDEL